MLRRLFSPEANVAVSGLIFIAGIALSIGHLVGALGQGEPPLVFQMSAVALIAAGYAAIVASVHRKEDADR